MTFSAASLFDPYRLDPNLFPGLTVPGAVRVVNTNSKTYVDWRTVPLVNSIVAIVIGQSLYANTCQDTYVATQARNLNFNISDGGCYSSAIPRLGANLDGTTNRGSLITRLGDNLIAHAKCTQFIGCDMAVGGTRVAEWANVSTPPALGTSIAVMAQRLRDAGLVATHILWGQGESDTLAGVSHNAYEAELNRVIQLFRDAGITATFYVNIETLISGNISPEIQLAQQNVVNGTTVKQGANFDTGIPAAQRYDGTHLLATGAATAATLLEAAIFP